MNKKRKLKRKKPRWGLYISFWLLIIATVTGLVVTQMSRFEGYQHQLTLLEAELARERQVGENLRYRQAFYESDAYIERLAREMLDFIRHDEIIFRNISD